MQPMPINRNRNRNLTHEEILERERVNQENALRDLEVNYPEIRDGMTREEINAVLRRNQELLAHDRFGRETHLTERDNILRVRIQEEAVNVQEVTSQANNTILVHQEIAETTQSIIELTAWYHQIDRYITMFHQSPMIFRIVLVSGVIVAVTGAVIVGIKIIRKVTSNNTVSTIITPFGPKKKLTFIGRVLEFILYK